MTERPAETAAKGGTAFDVEDLHRLVLQSLDDDQAQEVVSIPLAGKSNIADHMVIASGRSTRQVASMASKLAERIKAVNRIARNKRKINPKLSSKGYLAATASSKIPGKFAKDAKRRNLEGFLFPSTYQFEPQTTSRQLVNRQLQAFEQNWAKLDLAYAKSKNLTPYDVLIIASIVETPTTGTSKRMSCFGLATFTMRTPRPAS